MGSDVSVGILGDSVSTAELDDGAVTGVKIASGASWRAVETGSGSNVAGATLVETTYTLIANRKYKLVATITADAAGTISYALNSVVAGTIYDHTYLDNTGAIGTANNQATGVIGTMGAAADKQTIEVELPMFDATQTNMGLKAEGNDDANGFKYKYGSFNQGGPITVIGFTSSGQFDHEWTLYEL